MKQLIRRLQNQKKNFDTISDKIPNLSTLKDGESKRVFRKGVLSTYVRIGKKLYRQKFKPVNSEFADRSKIGSNFGIRPNFDSDWTTIANNQTYEFNHGLGTKFLMMEIFFKDGTASTDRIFNWTNHSSDNVFDGSSEDSGNTIYMKDNDTIVVGTGNYYVFVHDNAVTSFGGTAQRVTSGQIRIFCWKFFPSHGIEKE